MNTPKTVLLLAVVLLGSHAAGKEWLISKNRDIKRVTIFGPGTRHKTEIVSKDHAFGQDFRKALHIL